MSKSVANDVLDAALTEIATSTTLTVCSAEPANYAGIAAVALASVTVSGADFTIADGTTSGRKTTVAEQAGVSISASGDATHVALDDGTTLQYVTTAPTQTLTSGGTVTVAQWSVELQDPA